MNFKGILFNPVQLEFQQCFGVGSTGRHLAILYPRDVSQDSWGLAPERPQVWFLTITSKSRLSLLLTKIC